MKVNAEKFLDNLDQYKFEKTVFFISGNEEGLINKVKNIILCKHKSNTYSERKILNLKTNNKNYLKELTHTQSLFYKSNILQIKNPNDSLIESLEKINYDNNTIIIEGENIKNNSKIKKYFDFHKKFYSIVCYKLTKEFKKKLIDKLFDQHNCKLSKDAYWFFLENSSDDYQILENEVIKISNYGEVNASVEDISKLSGTAGSSQFEDLFFQCIVGSNQSIIKKSEIMIRSSADAYSFLQIVKKFLKILISSSERKNKNNIADLAKHYLPKYLFRQKNSFELAVSRADLMKIRIINNLLQKAELYIRKNDSRFLVIIQRFLLNFSKTIK
ncbi:MAG: hypothetical protein HVK46_03325 [Pelagibacteraceae bacterium]|jgi:DNA polymerase III delta subunit|nr:hypothetical protein [Pelagibacteraceae bacterium]MBO6468393.1 hypothetical protein [Pelagibacteraceae bacterium]MBO6479803.1 hypothetical protein [Pelagibacteraceae bacterium]MDP6783835.1 hypothetical protein [Alphaproteobacteria bacterium]